MVFYYQQNYLLQTSKRTETKEHSPHGIQLTSRGDKVSLCHFLPKFKVHLPQKFQQYKQHDTTMEIKA